MSSFKATICNIYLNRHILWRMASSRLKVKYSSSLLGVLWALINPLLIMAAITFVFTIVIKLDINNFALFALAGIFPWLFFANALFESAFSMLSQQSAMRQFQLPRVIIPLSSALASFLSFLIGWLVVYPIFLFFNQKVIILLPVLIIIVLLHFIFVCGLSMIVSVLNVFFRDLGHFLEVLVMFWFWVTPVFYSVDMIPDQFRWLFILNPMAYYVASYRAVLLNGHLPEIFIFIGLFLWGVLSLIVGFLLFSRFEGKIIKRL